MIRHIVLQGLVVAPFYLVSPVAWDYCQPLAAILVALSGFALIWSDHDLEADASVLAGAGLALTVLGMEPSGAFSRPGGYYVNPNIAGAALATLLPLSLRQRKWLYLVIMAAGLIATKSIGALLGCAAGFTVLALCHKPILQLVIRHRWLILAVLLVAMLLLGLLASWYMEARRLSGVTRLRLWKNALQMIRVSPLIGSGPGAFWRTQFVLGFEPSWSRVKPMIQPHPHNLYLHIAVDYGVIVLVIATAAAGLVFWKAGPAGKAAIAAAAAHNLVDAPLLFIQPALVLWTVVYISGAFDQFSKTKISQT